MRVDGIELFRKKVTTASTGENIGILLSKIEKDNLSAGDVITSTGAFLV